LRILQVKGMNRLGRSHIFCRRISEDLQRRSV
jgi:hypothetical protein